MKTKKNLSEINLNNKRILIRVDYNIPIKNNVIQNTFRIDTTIPTIRHCLDNNAKKIILISHLGKPNGVFNEGLSLYPVKEYLKEYYNFDIELCGLFNIQTCNKRLILLENIRFYNNEINYENNSFLKEYLTNLGDVFVNEAFGCSHRNHTSIIGIECKEKVSGFLLQKELNFLKYKIDNCDGPFVAIIGGSKVSDKIKLLNNLMPKIDHLIIGGGMAFTFLYGKGYVEIGESLFDKEGYKLLDEIYHSANINNVEIHLPIDTVIADNFSNDASYKICEGDIEDGWMGLDIGPQTIKEFTDIIKECKTILWNGPMGVFEFDNFKNGSIGLAESIKTATMNGSTSIVGGGDTSSFIINFGYFNDITHVSTGGGSSLKLLEEGMLPGIEFLDDK
jgi:phosphoglycerate kinase